MGYLISSANNDQLIRAKDYFTSTVSNAIEASSNLVSSISNVFKNIFTSVEGVSSERQNKIKQLKDLVSEIQRQIAPIMKDPRASGLEEITHFLDFILLGIELASNEKLIELEKDLESLKKILPDKDSLDDIEEDDSDFGGEWSGVIDSTEEEVDLDIIPETSKEEFISVLKERALNLQDNLSKLIIGQNSAIDAVCGAIYLRMAGLSDQNKPIAKLLFTGSTGVGKTEMAKAIASEFFGASTSILSINAPEYVNEAGIQRLIGPPVGYKESEKGGLLTNFVQKNEYSVILVDEVEKGSSDIMDLFLKILDEGKIQDGRGKVTDFKNTVVIFTSNQLNQSYFKPEFLGRLDKIVAFNPISKEMNDKIVDLELEKLQNKAQTTGLKIEVSEKLRHFLYNQTFKNSTGKGAREIKNMINSFVAIPLSRQILFSASTKDYFLDFDNGKCVINPTFLDA
ncbi:MAG: ATP-dependent Clp protease ATP-binding subunit [Verrucomicrobia bacterium]|nr:ATP-dependent Clp protease ATP-binding subunit [Verrucomicrobiota bacterium]